MKKSYRCCFHEDLDSDSESYSDSEWDSVIDESDHIQLIPTFKPSYRSAFTAMNIDSTNDSSVCKIEQLCEGTCFLVTGIISQEADRFSVNFVTNERDIALHINPRFSERQVVRNTKEQDNWGSEERRMCAPFMFHQGKRFVIQVLITNSCYLMSFNGDHFDHYVHRLPFQDVNFLEVNGDVEHVRIHSSQICGYPYPIKNLLEGETRCTEVASMVNYPSFQAKVRSLHDGDSFIISTEIDPKCIEFQIDFKCDDNSQCIPFHINANLQKHHLIFNTRVGRAWGSDQTVENVQFRLGDRCTIQILVTNSYYLVAINGKHYAQYKHRMPFDVVATLEIYGGLQQVQLHRHIVIDYPMDIRRASSDNQFV